MAPLARFNILYFLLLILSPAILAQETTLAIHGSNTVGAKLGPELIRGFLNFQAAAQIKTSPGNRENETTIQALLHQSVTINIAAHGSSTGFRGLEHSNTPRADIAMSSRAIKAKEIKKLSYLGDMKSLSAEHIIAIDGLAILVHPDNVLTQLSVDNIAKIFSGEINNWQQLGAHKGEIKLYARDDNSGTWDTFKNLVLAKKYTLSHSASRFESNDRLSDSVAADPNGIGFTGLASVRQAKLLAVSDDNSDSHLANTTALKPSKLSVASEDYPLSRRLYLYTKAGVKSDFVQKFLDFCQSQQGQEIVEKIGFISQYPLAMESSQYRQGPTAYLEATTNAQRLSINFRFTPYSSNLDNKAQRDILRLVKFLKRQSKTKRKILLIGFGDLKQTDSRSLVLSKLRATIVKSALREHGISSEPVLGFGAFKPVANNHSNNRIKNRRVEIWIK